MANYISISVTLVPSQDSFVGINIGGTTYPTNILATSPTFEADVLAFLNGIGLGNNWTVVYDSESGLLTITSACLNDAFGPTPVPYIILDDRIVGERTFEFDIVECQNTDCVVELCNYEVEVFHCDYVIDYSPLTEQSELIDELGANISQIRIEDGGPVNILPSPINCTNYTDLITELNVLLQNFLFTTFPTGAAVTNSFIEFSSIQVSIITPGPDPDVTITLTFEKTGCGWSQPGLVFGSNTATLFPANISMDIDPVTAYIGNNITSFPDLISSLGNESFGPWQYDGEFYTEGSPYNHTNLVWSTDYFYNETNWPALEAFIIPTRIVKYDCANSESLDIKGALTINCEDTSCIIFKDTTGLYDAENNPSGYGYPNYPGYSNISSTQFTLVNNTTSTTIGTYDFNYIPTAAGLEICLTIDDFATGYTLVPGNSYTIQYTVKGDNEDELKCLNIPFVMSYCGATIDSDIEIDFQPKQNPGCGKLTICDTTGEYDVDTNPTGYCGVNPCYDDIDHIEVKVVLPDGGIVFLYPTFIPSATVTCFDITAADLGYTDGLLPDGIYEITYKVWGEYDSVIGVKTYKTLLFCQTKACLDSTGRVLLSDCPTLCAGDDTKKAIDKWIKLRLKLDEVIYASTVNIDCVEGEIEKILKECQKGCYGC